MDRGSGSYLFLLNSCLILQTCRVWFSAVLFHGLKDQVNFLEFWATEIRWVNVQCSASGGKTPPPSGVSMSTQTETFPVRPASSTTPAHPTAILAIILVSYLVIVLDISIVLTGLPKIQRNLGFSSTSLAWVQSAYILAFGGLLLSARARALIARVLFLGAMASSWFFTTQYLQEVLGLSALQAGLAFLPASVVIFGTALLVSNLTRLLGLGLFIRAVGLG